MSVGFPAITSLNDATSQCQNNTLLTIVINLHYEQIVPSRSKAYIHPEFMAQLDSLFAMAEEYRKRGEEVKKNLREECNLKGGILGLAMGDILSHLHRTEDRLQGLIKSCRDRIASCKP